jgi:hypothetical protein
MGKHHHHPDEGHSAGAPPGTGRRRWHHSPFFWVAGFFLFLALTLFILEYGGVLHSNAAAHIK